MNCRHCGELLRLTMIDLGTSPPSNAYLSKQKLDQPEIYYPLRVMVCEQCWLVQTEDFTVAGQLFDDEYAYFSSYSSSWLKHAQDYVDAVIRRFSLDQSSRVVELAANDGYLLQYVQQHQIPCFGIEPTQSTAEVAISKGIKIVQAFFGVDLANKLVAQHQQADLIVANNVLAHVPDINDFAQGVAILLKPDGVATFEFPHLAKLIDEHQFDTIYHEHFSYLSLVAVRTIFNKNGLQIFDVEQLITHGGSLRVYAQRADTGLKQIESSVEELISFEINEGMNSNHYYSALQIKAEQTKMQLLQFLLQAKQQDKKVAAYGAAAKGNTLLNFAGIRADLINFVVDKNPAKQDKYLPGSRIPIVDEKILEAEKPDYLLILPWNIKLEIKQQLDYVKSWGTQFVTVLPEIKVE